ncbi:hypothetical protein T492DRAFT_850071 [Pavlovales sp. CCMP2436]|nr:hypothetical protein T492DRAFT_850071 [Pavlovales sp. CCMP2436]
MVKADHRPHLIPTRTVARYNLANYIALDMGPSAAAIELVAAGAMVASVTDDAEGGGAAGGLVLGGGGGSAVPFSLIARMRVYCLANRAAFEHAAGREPKALRSYERALHLGGGDVREALLLNRAQLLLGTNLPLKAAADARKAAAALKQQLTASNAALAAVRAALANASAPLPPPPPLLSLPSVGQRPLRIADKGSAAASKQPSSMPMPMPPAGARGRRPAPRLSKRTTTSVLEVLLNGGEAEFDEAAGAAGGGAFNGWRERALRAALVQQLRRHRALRLMDGLVNVLLGATQLRELWTLTALADFGQAARAVPGLSLRYSLFGRNLPHEFGAQAAATALRTAAAGGGAEEPLALGGVLGECVRYLAAAHGLHADGSTATGSSAAERAASVAGRLLGAALASTSAAELVTALSRVQYTLADAGAVRARALLLLWCALAEHQAGSHTSALASAKAADGALSDALTASCKPAARAQQQQQLSTAPGGPSEVAGRSIAGSNSVEAEPAEAAAESAQIARLERLQNALPLLIGVLYEAVGDGARALKRYSDTIAQSPIAASFGLVAAGSGSAAVRARARGAPSVSAASGAQDDDAASVAPSFAPSYAPSCAPSYAPSYAPSFAPSYSPSWAGSVKPPGQSQKAKGAAAAPTGPLGVGTLARPRVSNRLSNLPNIMQEGEEGEEEEAKEGIPASANEAAPAAESAAGSVDGASVGDGASSHTHESKQPEAEEAQARTMEVESRLLLVALLNRGVRSGLPAAASTDGLLPSTDRPRPLCTLTVPLSSCLHNPAARHSRDGSLLDALRDIAAAVALSSQLHARSLGRGRAASFDDEELTVEEEGVGVLMPRSLAELARMAALLREYLEMVEAGFDARPARDFCAKQVWSLITTRTHTHLHTVANHSKCRPPPFCAEQGELLLALERLRAQTDESAMTEASSRKSAASMYASMLGSVDGYLRQMYDEPLVLFSGTATVAETPANAFVALVGATGGDGESEGSDAEGAAVAGETSASDEGSDEEAAAKGSPARSPQRGRDERFSRLDDRLMNRGPVGTPQSVAAPDSPPPEAGRLTRPGSAAQSQGGSLGRRAARRRSSALPPP